MFNDALDEPYWNNVLRASRKFKLVDSSRGNDESSLNYNMHRQNIFVARYSEAFAQSSTGTAYMVLLNYQGDAQYDKGGLPGVFQNPLPNDKTNLNPNQFTWGIHELPTLQRNAKINSIMSIDLDNKKATPPPYAKHHDWPIAGPNAPPLRPKSNSNLIPIPETRTKRTLVGGPLVDTPYLRPPNPQPPGHPRLRQRRDSMTECTADFLADTPTTILVLSTTNPPTSAPSWSHHDQSPEVESEYCVCQGSITLPVLSAPSTALNDPLSSCAYTTIPASSAQVLPTTTALGPPITDIPSCQICTPYALNEANCSSIPSCTIQFRQTPTAYVQAGSSLVHVGTLTSTALSSSIASALQKVCPTVTQTTVMTVCETDTVTIQNIPYRDPGAGSLEQGELQVKVKASQYNATSLRNAMIDSAALTAMKSATGKNCYEQEYTIESFRKRGLVSGLRQSLGLEKRDHPLPTHQHMTMCMASSFAGVQYKPPFWRKAQDPATTVMWIDTEWDFHIPPGGDFDCAFIQDLIEGLAVIAPEFTAQEMQLGEAVGAFCEAAMEHV